MHFSVLNGFQMYEKRPKLGRCLGKNASQGADALDKDWTAWRECAENEHGVTLTECFEGSASSARMITVNHGCLFVAWLNGKDGNGNDDDNDDVASGYFPIQYA